MPELVGQSRMPRGRRRRAVAAALTAAALMTAAGGPASAAASVPASGTAGKAALIGPASGAGGKAAAPEVTGPVTGGEHGFPFTASSVELRSHGYAEQEYFFSGTAHAYTSDAPLAADGRWTVEQGAAAPYRSRMVVRTPMDPRKFNGTVLVEWLNVSAQRDIDVDWDYGYNRLMDEGFAYVGVTAQVVGRDALAAWDPARYGSLSIPSDDYSYDIFSQAGQALRDTGPGSPLGGLRARHLLADGESQSAGRLTTYVNAVAPAAKVYDGYLIHSRGAAGAPLSGTLRPPSPTFLRTDLARPVLVFQTETDVRGSAPARQPDDRYHRLWEAAGTAHVDSSVMTLMGYQGHRQTSQSADPECASQPNAAPQHVLFDTAVSALREWVRADRQPPRAPRMTMDAAGADVARDEHGNGLGGLRLPQLDVPTATLTGTGNRPADTNPISAFCVLFGTTTPFGDAKLAGLYPSRAAYLKAFTAATRELARDGFLLPDGEEYLLYTAGQTRIPG